MNHTIRKISPDGVVSTRAGSAGVEGSADGTSPQARFRLPKGLATDRLSNLYVADSLNNTIRKITPTGTVSTLAGEGGHPGGSDGSGAEARFDNPRGVAADSAGNVYVQFICSIHPISDCHCACWAASIPPVNGCSIVYMAASPV